MKGALITSTTLKTIFALIVSIIVVAAFMRGMSESIQTKCWADAKSGFENLFAGLKGGEGKKNITLGECVSEVYLIKKDAKGKLPDLGGVNIFSCSRERLDDPEYQSFAILEPVGDYKVKDVGGRDIREALLKTECVSYKQEFAELRIGGKNTEKAVFEGNKKYCIIITVPKDASGNPVGKNVKSVVIADGECG